MSEPIELLEIADLMQLLKISRSAAYRLAESLGGYRIGRSIRIDAEDRLEVSREIPAALRVLEATSPVPAQQPEPVQ